MTKRQGGHRKVWVTILSIVIFVLGLALLLYPAVSNQWNTWRQSLLITSYEDVVLETPAADLASEWERAWAYNEALLPSVLPDSFAIAEAQGEPGAEYMACLNLAGDGIMGYVSVPKINIKLPIYHTTTDEVLQKGAGHLEGSSLPVGGENTHAVLAAHRGLASAALFTDLDLVGLGDHFYLYILDDVLAYEVDQIKVVEPEDTEALSVEQGKDLVTLLTCTPYGVNSHRLLVRGHRVPYEPEVEQDESRGITVSRHTSYGLWIALGLIAVAIVVIVFYVVQRKKGRKHE